MCNISVLAVERSSRLLRRWSFVDVPRFLPHLPLPVRLLPLLLLMLLGASPAAAHDLWIERQGADWVLLRGHAHSSHEGETQIPYEIAIIRQITCCDVQGDTVGCRPSAEYPLRVPVEGWAAICVLTSSGYWTKTPYGTQNLPRAETAQPIHSWLSYEGVKCIETWAPRFAEALTAELEIVPLENPFALSVGEKLTVMVVLDGDPCAEAIVTYDGEPRGKTGADGMLNVRLRHHGLQMIQATVRLADPTGVADEIVRTTTLNFSLPEG